MVQTVKKQKKAIQLLTGSVIVLALIVIVQGAYLIAQSKDKNPEVQKQQPVFGDMIFPGSSNHATHSQSQVMNQARQAWDPFSEMERMQERMNRMFRESMRRSFAVSAGVQPTGIASSLYEPDADIQDKEDHYLILMDLPGMEKDKIKIDASENSLTVSGERKIEKQTEEDGFFRMERSFGTFSRQIPLPENVQVENIQAKYEDGVLALTVPKEDATAQKYKNHPIQIG